MSDRTFCDRCGRIGTEGGGVLAVEYGPQRCERRRFDLCPECLDHLLLSWLDPPDEDESPERAPVVETDALAPTAAGPAPLTDNEVDRLWRTQTEQEWTAACRDIKTRRGGHYPGDWHARILATGLMAAVSSSWRPDPPAPLTIEERLELAMQGRLTFTNPEESQG